MKKPDWLRKGILLIPTQGFGNRMRMMADTWILCRLWDVPLYVFWKSDRDCECEATDIFKGNQSGLLEWKPFSELSSYEYTYCGIIHTHEILHSVIHKPQAFSPKDYLLLVGGHEFRHPHMSLDDFLYMKHLFYRSIRWSAGVTKRIAQFYETAPTKYIGIHYREYYESGDGADANNKESSVKLFNPARFSDNSPLTEFAQWIMKTPTEYPALFITNRPSAYEELQNLLPKEHAKRLVMRPKESSERTTVQGIVDAVVDFALLANSVLILGSFYSSFSDEATLLHLVPKICPMSPGLLTTLKQQIGKQTIGQHYHCFDCRELTILEQTVVGLHVSTQAISPYIRFSRSSF